MEAAYQEAPGPTCHLRARCDWRAATGHRCELEPHTLAVLHKITLDDGSVRSVGDAQTPRVPLSTNNIAATLNRLSVLESHSAAHRQASNILVGRVDGIEERLDAIEKRENCDACEGGGRMKYNVATGLLTAPDGTQHPISYFDWRARHKRAIEERDSALAQCAAAVQAGEALRIECDSLTAQMDAAEHSRDVATEQARLLMRQRDDALRAQGEAEMSRESWARECDDNCKRAGAAEAALAEARKERCTAHDDEWCPDAQREVNRLEAENLEAGDQLRDEQRERERLRADNDRLRGELVKAQRHLNPPSDGPARPCCGSLPCYKSTGEDEGEGTCTRRNVGVRAADAACVLTFAEPKAP